jgi:RHS repeat-associated protein
MTATTRYYHFDGLGSTDRLTDAAGNVTDSYGYRAYGEEVASTGSTTNPFRYVGRLGYYFDEETDDYYVRARHYDPATARWVSEDPIGYDGGQWNLHEYILGNPIEFSDPSGKKLDWCCFAECLAQEIGGPEPGLGSLCVGICNICLVAPHPVSCNACAFCLGIVTGICHSNCWYDPVRCWDQICTFKYYSVALGPNGSLKATCHYDCGFGISATGPPDYAYQIGRRFIVKCPERVKKTLCFDPDTGIVR